MRISSPGPRLSWNLPIVRVWVLLCVALGSSCTGFGQPGKDDPKLSCGSSGLEEHSERLYTSGEFEQLYIEMARCAGEGEPEAQFAAAMLLQAEGSENFSQLDLNEREEKALGWIHSSAMQGHKIAVETLASSYEHGRLGLPVDLAVAKCLSDSVGNVLAIRSCLSVEAKPEKDIR